MQYPDYFTAQDIMEFEYEWERYCDLDDPASIESVNAELQIVAQEQHYVSAEISDIFA